MMVSLTAQNTSLIFSVSAGFQFHNIDVVLLLDVKEKKSEIEIRTSSEFVFTCGAGEVRIDDFLCVRIQVHEHSKDELSCRYCILLRT